MIHKKYIFTAILYIFSAGSILAEPVRLATTTSTDNSGLIKELLPYFEKEKARDIHETIEECSLSLISDECRNKYLEN